MVKINTKINGTLIVGGVGEGKTTMLAHKIRLWLTCNPYWRLIAVGSVHFFENLHSDIREDGRHEFYTVKTVLQQGGDQIQSRFLECLTSLLNQTENKILIAIDEPAMFFADANLRERFTQLLIDKTQSPTPFRLLMTAQELRIVIELFGDDFAHVFTQYTLLKNRTNEDFFAHCAVDVTQLKHGEAIQLERSEESEQANRLLRVTGKVKFTPGKPEIDPVAGESWISNKLLYFTKKFRIPKIR